MEQVHPEVREQYEQLRTTFWKKIKLRLTFSNLALLMGIFLIVISITRNAGVMKPYYFFLTVRYFMSLILIGFMMLPFLYLRFQSKNTYLFIIISGLVIAVTLLSISSYYAVLMLKYDYQYYLINKQYFKKGFIPYVIAAIVIFLLTLACIYVFIKYLQLGFNHQIPNNIKIIQILNADKIRSEYTVEFELLIENNVYKKTVNIFDFKLEAIIDRKRTIKAIYSPQDPSIFLIYL